MLSVSVWPARLRHCHPGIGVVILSRHADEAYVIELLREASAGLGCLLKESVGDRDELVRALRETAAGGSAVDPDSHRLIPSESLLECRYVLRAEGLVQQGIRRSEYERCGQRGRLRRGGGGGHVAPPDADGRDCARACH